MSMKNVFKLLILLKIFVHGQKKTKNKLDKMVQILVEDKDRGSQFAERYIKMLKFTF